MLDLSKETRAICRALKIAADKARAAGIKNPAFYVESESMGIFVMNDDMDNLKDGSANKDAIVGVIRLVDIGAKLDTGAW